MSGYVVADSEALMMQKVGANVKSKVTEDRKHIQFRLQSSPILQAYLLKLPQVPKQFGEYIFWTRKVFTMKISIT